jgi:hypothetical protein
MYSTIASLPAILSFMHPTNESLRACSSDDILGMQMPGVSIMYAKGVSHTLNPKTLRVVQGKGAVDAIFLRL